MKSKTKHFMLDCSEFDCPMVLVQLKESLERIQFGQTVEVITPSEPRFQILLKIWTAETNDSYYDFYLKEDFTHHFIKKAAREKRNEPKKYSMMVSNEELKEIVQQGMNAYLLDVREDIEFMLGHVPAAINVPLSDFTSRIFNFAKDKTYYVMCRTGNRSDFACKYMESLGFKNVYNVLPGMSEWNGSITEEDTLNEVN